MVEELGGTIAQYLGDGLLIYFGYPHAHEDDPIRALHAALQLLDEMPRTSERIAAGIPLLHERPLQIRIGVHAGPVVMAAPDAAAHQEPLAVGETPNLAARLQGEAAAGSVLISGSTERLVRGAFELEALGERALRGITEPVPIFRVLAASGLAGLARRRGVGLSHFVGRAAELAYLESFVEQAARGQGRAVLVEDEAGIGKSRLVAALREGLAGRAHEWLELRGSALDEHSSFHPVVERARAALGLDALESDDERLAEIESALRDAGVRKAEPTAAAQRTPTCRPAAAYVRY